MPSRGLESVVQPFSIDASGYVTGKTTIIGAAKEISGVNTDLMRSFEEMQRTLRSLPDAAQGMRGISDQARSVAASMRDATEAVKGFTSSQDATMAQVMKANAQIRDQLDLLGRHSSTINMVNAAQQRAAEVTGLATDALRDQARVVDAGRDSLRTYTENLGALEGRADSVTRKMDALGDSFARTTAAAASVGPNLDKIASDAGFSSYRDLIAASGLGPPGGGGAGPGGGGPGGGGPGGGGGGGFFMSGAAATQWGSAASAISTWYPRIHYAMMATNEILATVGPAAIALAAGAAVGLQGGQQLYNRGTAVNAVGQSLGPSLGQTPGSFAGLGQGLQRAQNLYGAGVYEMFGGVVNSMKAGAGGGFNQMGEDVVAMFDRAFAGVTMDFQHGLGTKLQGLAGQGVSDLAQFGSIGANLGKTFVNTASNLPGVGGDILTTLQAATGGLAKVTGYLGPLMGPILAFEAASRYGPTIVGGAGALVRNTGIGLAGLGDTIAGATEGFGSGVISDALMGGGMGLVTAGGTLGGLGSLAIGGAGALAYLVGKSLTYKTPYQQADAAILSNVNQMGPVQGIPSIISGMRQMAQVGSQPNLPGYDLGTQIGRAFSAGGERGSNFGATANSALSSMGHSLWTGVLGTGSIEKKWSSLLSVGHDIPWLLGLAGAPQTKYQAAQSTLQTLLDTMVNAIGTGKQVQKVWDDVSHSTTSMATANNIATMAALQLGSAYEKGGKLTATAKTQIANLYAGYAPMVMNTGQFGAATGAVTAMQGLAGTKIGAVNQAYDQLTSLVQGGAAGAAGDFGLLKGAPATSTAAATPGVGNLSSSLGSFTSAAGAQSWNTLTNTQTGLFPALEGQMDWLREAQTMMGTQDIGGKGRSTTGMAAYQIAQMLPTIGQNPAALAMLSTYAQMYGGPSFKAGMSGASMYKSLSQWAQKNGLTTPGYNAAMTTATENMANIPSDSNQFVQTVQSQLVGGLGQGVATYGGNLQSAILASMGGGGKLDTADLGRYFNLLKGAGVPKGAAKDMASYLGQIGGATKGQQVTINAIIKATWDIPKPPHVFGQIIYQNMLPKLPHPTTTGTINWTSVLGGPLPTPAGGIPFATAVTRHQSGFRVPGYGGGDIHPAFLEGGEAVVPKHLVPQIAPFLSAHGVPGFAAGGLAGLGIFEYDTGKSIQSLAQAVASLASAVGGGSNVMPAAAQKVFNAYDATLPKGIWGQFASQMLQGLIDGVKNAPHETAKMAQALVSQVTQAVTYGKGVAAAAKQGGGYNPWGGGSTLLGTFGNFATPTTTAGGQPYQYYTDQQAVAGGGTLSVQQQMGDYLQAMKSFQGDLGKLSKAGLNKNLMQQLLAAGPLQGDQEAQSILGGAGGAARRTSCGPRSARPRTSWVPPAPGTSTAGGRASRSPSTPILLPRRPRSTRSTASPWSSASSSTSAAAAGAAAGGRGAVPQPDQASHRAGPGNTPQAGQDQQAHRSVTPWIRDLMVYGSVNGHALPSGSRYPGTGHQSAPAVVVCRSRGTRPPG